jgi:hypothetical protein
MAKNDEFWKQFRTKEEILRDKQYERHQSGDCTNDDKCESCDNESEDS